jgi:hypothetical protein
MDVRPERAAFGTFLSMIEVRLGAEAGNAEASSAWTRTASAWVAWTKIAPSSSAKT